MAIRVKTLGPAGGEDRALDARAANDRIAEKADRLQFLSRVPMLCECSAPSCRTLVMIGLPDFEEIRRDPHGFLTAPGHEVEGAKLETEAAEYEVRRGSRYRYESQGHARSA
jgi:hypothetical protein